MPLATDFASFGAIGVPQFVNPGTSQSNFPYQGSTWFNTGPYRKPIASDLTVTGTVTLNDKLDRLQMVVPSATSTLVVAMQPLIATPYTLDTLVCMQGAPASGDGTEAGIALSDGTKYVTALVVCIGGVVAASDNRVVRTSWTNRTTVSTSAGGNALLSGLVWLRITDDGTTRIFYYSLNGKDFVQYNNENTNTFATPTTWGLAGYHAAISGAGTAKIAFYHMQASAGLLGDAP
jgi:hypothetical protein